jgi:hypothetical protein
VKRESLLFALHQTRNALRSAEAAATWFSVNPRDLENAHTALSCAEVEIGKLMEEEDKPLS